jgi:hypothetical protein
MPTECSGGRSNFNQDAEKVRQRKKTVSWFIWFVSFVWLNETYQMNQINQINKTNRSTRRAMLDEDGLFEHPELTQPERLPAAALFEELCSRHCELR